MLRLRPLWESICAGNRYTIFQDFGLNLLAARMFAAREQLLIVTAETTAGAAIIPAAVRVRDGVLRLLGEELFDYRCFLHQGDAEAMRAATAELGRHGLPLEIVAVREQQAATLPKEFTQESFCGAPKVVRAEISADQFAATHLRLARNLRRLARLGFEPRRYRGEYPGLIRAIYEKKAAQNSTSLFHDPLRIEFMVNASRMMPDAFEVFTLEDEASIAAAIVTLRDHNDRRFYTGWFAPELNSHSPGLSLIYEVTRQSLEKGLDCDYMTGEQPYKMRLATSAVRLFRVRATADQLASNAQDQANMPLAV